MPKITNLQTRVTVRRMFLFVLAVAGIGFALRACVLAPLYTRMVSDILYRDRWWIVILYYLTDGGLLDLAVFCLCYPATLYVVWQAGLKDAARIPILYAALTVLKFVAFYFTDFFSDGGFRFYGWEYFLRSELPVILPQILFELLQYALMLLFICLCRRKYVSRRFHAGKPAETFGQDVFPVQKLLNLHNPVQCALFWTAIVILLGRMGMHFIYQLNLYQWYGMTEGWPQMLIDLVCDLAIAAVFYFVSLLLLMRFHDRDAALEKSDA